MTTISESPSSLPRSVRERNGVLDMAEATTPRPIALTDAQMTAVLAACAPLQQIDRPAFLEALANLLSGHSEIGDGRSRSMPAASYSANFYGRSAAGQAQPTASTRAWACTH
jgi:hypothetical protein